MYIKAIKYKDIYLAPGSQAYQLYEDKKFQELDKHLKTLDQAEAELVKRYKKAEVA